MIELWIPKNRIPAAEHVADNSNYQKAILPDKCKDCGNKFILTDNGSAQHGASIHGICEHYSLWEKIWSNRIKESDSDQVIKFTVVKNRSYNIDPKNDGMKCSGSCGNWTPMAASNQADGSFICYGCRTRI